jgi:hypothetical protein
MRYLLLACLLLVCLALAGFGLWTMHQSALAPFLLPDAAQLAVTQPGAGTTAIQYHAEATTWRRRLSQQLAKAGWAVHTYANPGAILPQWEYVSWYTRETWFGPVGVQERAIFVIDPRDPTHVHMQLHRTLTMQF